MKRDIGNFFLSAIFLMLLAFPSLASAEKYENAVETSFSKNEVYPNEQTLLTYSLFTRVDLRYDGFKKESKYPYQWFEMMPFDGNIKTKTVIHKGLKAITIDVRKTALFPIKAGKFELLPGSIKLHYKKPRSFFNNPPVDEVMEYPPVSLTVREFPPEGMPSDFNRLSGNFELKAECTVVQENNGDTILLKLEVTGEGNIRQISLPAFDLPEGLTIQSVNEEVDIKWKGDEVTGSKKFAVKILPSKTGTFKIPGPHFSYFNPTNKEYVKISGNVLRAEIGKIPQKPPSEPPLSGNRICILLDISGSMLARDLNHRGRIDVAKESIQALLSHSQMRKSLFEFKTFARVVKDKWSFTVPGKIDMKLLTSVETAQGDSDGTAIGSAIYEGANSFKLLTGAGKNFILLITDGVLNSGYIDSATAASFAAEKNIPIYSIAIGKGGMVPFPIKDKDFGDRFTTAEVDIDTQALAEVSKLTNGKAYIVKTEEDFKLAVQELVEKFSA